MHASCFGQCAVVTKLCVYALKRLQGAGALDYFVVEWPRALLFVRYCWRISNRSHAAFFGSSVVSKSCCMHPEPTSEVITAKFREISRPACEGYGRFERRALRRSSPTASCNHLRVHKIITSLTHGTLWRFVVRRSPCFQLIRHKCIRASVLFVKLVRISPSSCIMKRSICCSAA